MKNCSKAQRIISFLVPTVIICIFILSLVPVLGLAKYDFASGDDYGYGWRAHAAWLNTGSLWETIKAAVETVRVYFYSWQGTWFTIVLMALQPEVFSSNAYWITPWIMTLLIIASTTCLFGYLNKRYTAMPRGAWISIDLLVLLAMIQCFPSKKSSLFWYNGCAHYVYPYALAVIAIWAIMNFRDRKTKRHYAIATIALTLLGGASYLSPLITIIVLIYLWVVDLAHKRNRHMLWMLIPFVLELVGLAVSYAAPGNNIRALKEADTALSFSPAVIVHTVIGCFKMAFVGIGEYFVSYPFVFVCLIGVGIIAAYVMITCGDKAVASADDFGFRHPVLFVALMFCIYAATYAPGIFSQAKLSGGVPNTIFQFFVITTAVSIVYVIGWFSTRTYKRSEKKKGFQIAIYIAIPVICLMWMAFARSTVKSTTSYMCYSYISSGRAADYRSQIQYNYSILLDDSNKECVICPINDDQGPLMHMPVVNDKDAFTNLVVRQFFGKEKVTVDDSLQINAGN